MTRLNSSPPSLHRGRLHREKGDRLTIYDTNMVIQSGDTRQHNTTGPVTRVTYVTYMAITTGMMIRKE